MCDKGTLWIPDFKSRGFISLISAFSNPGHGSDVFSNGMKNRSLLSVMIELKECDEIQITVGSDQTCARRRTGYSNCGWEKSLDARPQQFHYEEHLFSVARESGEWNNESCDL